MRKVKNWVSGWLEYSAGIESPFIFRSWTALSTISAALQRRVWIRVKGQKLFPNIYVILVGPPGVGKGNAMRGIRYWFEDIDHIHLAPDIITKRSLYDSLESATVADFDNPLEHDCALFAYIEELGVFLNAGDNDFLYSVCHLYDCPSKVHYKTFGAGEHHIENACFGFLAGATPKSLKDIFTDQAMELGISARTVLVFSDEKVNVNIFSEPEKNKTLAKDLQDDLRAISQIKGEYIVESSAAESIVSWVDSGMNPIPQDPRFEHYNTRRFIQFIKLCIHCSAAEQDDPVILPSHVEAAKTLLLEAERFMPKAIQSLGANPLLAQQQQALKYINSVWLAEKRPVPESELRRRLSNEVHPQYIEGLIELLASAKWVETFGDKPNRKFTPRGAKSE